MMRLLVNGRTQNGSDRPAAVQTMTDDRRWYPREFRPLYRHHAFAFPRNGMVDSFIPRLLARARPAAVLWGIALVVVDAIKGILRRGTGPHVFGKRLERISPFQAHRNTATSIPAVGNMLGIAATLNHSLPNRVFGALTHPVFGKVKPSYFLIHFLLETAATFRISTTQRTRTNDNAISTGTTTQPARIVAFRSRWLHRREPSELLLGEISKIHRGIIAESGKTRQQNFRGGN